jgi:hypothetical protein
MSHSGMGRYVCHPIPEWDVPNWMFDRYLVGSLVSNATTPFCNGMSNSGIGQVNNNDYFYSLKYCYSNYDSHMLCCKGDTYCCTAYRFSCICNHSSYNYLCSYRRRNLGHPSLKLPSMPREWIFSWPPASFLMHSVGHNVLVSLLVLPGNVVP